MWQIWSDPIATDINGKTPNDFTGSWSSSGHYKVYVAKVNMKFVTAEGFPYAVFCKGSLVETMQKLHAWIYNSRCRFYLQLQIDFLKWECQISSRND